MDAPTIELLLKLQIDDANELLEEHGNSDGQCSDLILALTETRDEYVRAWQTMEDRRIALGLNQACQADRALLASAVEEENRAVQDHELARQLAGLPARPTDSAAARDTINETASVLSTLDDYEHRQEVDADAATSIASPPFLDDESDCERGGPSSYKDKGKARADDHVVCCSCQDDKLHIDTVQLSCEPEPHSYCADCLVELFERSMKDTELFPPRCCRIPIPLDLAKVFFTPEFVKTFEEKSVELSTPNPTYCSDSSCSKFVSPTSIKDEVATCPACHHTTCTRCKNTTHDGLCPDDPNKRALMDTARQEGWQQCYSCRNMVELDVGCNHMTYVDIFLDEFCPAFDPPFWRRPNLVSL